jgi:hypothetical protein
MGRMHGGQEHRDLVTAHGIHSSHQVFVARDEPLPRGGLVEHGAVDLESGQTKSTIGLLESLELLYPLMVCIHDNAHYHHARFVNEWLSRTGCQIKLRLLSPPSPLPASEPDRVASTRTSRATEATCKDFAEATLEFLRDRVPRNWANTGQYRSSVTDKVSGILPKTFLVTV